MKIIETNLLPDDIVGKIQYFIDAELNPYISGDKKYQLRHNQMSDEVVEFSVSRDFSREHCINGTISRTSDNTYEIELRMSLSALLLNCLAVLFFMILLIVNGWLVFPLFIASICLTFYYWFKSNNIIGRIFAIFEGEGCVCSSSKIDRSNRSQLNWLKEIISFLRTKTLIADILAFVCVPISMFCFYIVISFFNAETPETAIDKWQQPLPEGWTAGVMNHGSYYKWWTISERPVLFIVSLAGLILTQIIVIKFIVRRRKRSKLSL